MGLPRFSRLVAWTMFLWLACAVTTVFANDGSAPAEDNFWWELLSSLFNSKKLMATLAKPQFQVLAFVAMNLIVFVETGLLIGFFLPGDSLLVVAGLIAAGGAWPLHWLLITLTISAIVGDSVGYSIGWNTGPKIFNRENSWLFHKDHLLKAQDFYVRHGGKTIILARFMPIVRTFAPVVAGVGRMDYRQFLFFNIIGGVGWVFSMVLTGYFLPPLLNPLLAPVFGAGFKIEEHVEKVVIVVVFLSIAPGIFMWLKSRFSKQSPTLVEPAPAVMPATALEPTPDSKASPQAPVVHRM